MATLADVRHTEVPIQGGGKVLILDTGSVIGPEAAAMLGALHSRSIGGIQSHLKVLEEKGAENFMTKFYVGYGHKSIGDMAHICTFIEGVSLLAAKAIQDSRLYNGQEASTRYIDFARQPFLDPVGTKNSKNILEGWRAFYLHGIEALPPYLKEKYPLNAGEAQAVYDKAILARAYDIMRAFLPAGAATNLAWYGSVRVIGDRLPTLRHHPLEEVRNIAVALEDALVQAHPNSFTHKHYETTETYLEQAVPALTYVDIPECPEFAVTRDTFDHGYLRRLRDLLSSRPARTELPRFLDDAGEIQFEYLLDFGSYRDVQRHRTVVQRMPLLTTRFGFEPWYLEEMPETLRRESVEFIEKQRDAIHSLSATPEVAQYYVPMGYRTANRLTATLPAITYLVELRTGSTVHSTMRTLAQHMGVELEKRLKDTGFVLHLDRSENRFDTKRGTHDIVMK